MSQFAVLLSAPFALLRFLFDSSEQTSEVNEKATTRQDVEPVPFLSRPEIPFPHQGPSRN